MSDRFSSFERLSFLSKLFNVVIVVLLSKLISLDVSSESRLIRFCLGEFVVTGITTRDRYRGKLPAICFAGSALTQPDSKASLFI